MPVAIHRGSGSVKAVTSYCTCNSTDTCAHLVLQIPDVSGYEPGQALNVEDLFKVGDLVDVAGTSIGKGFQGTGLPTPVAPQLHTTICNFKRAALLLAL